MKNILCTSSVAAVMGSENTTVRGTGPGETRGRGWDDVRVQPGRRVSMGARIEAGFLRDVPNWSTKAPGRAVTWGGGRCMCVVCVCVCLCVCVCVCICV